MHNDLLRQLRTLIKEGKVKRKDVLEELEDKPDVETIASKTSYSEGRKMGLPEEWMSPDKVWPRSFRFVLFSEEEKLVNIYTQEVGVDVRKKELKVKILEGDRKIYDWVIGLLSKRDPVMDTWRLVTYDGCGMPLYSLEFTEVTGKKHNLNFDYSKSDIVTHEMVLSYNDLQREDLQAKSKALADNAAI